MARAYHTHPAAQRAARDGLPTLSTTPRKRVGERLARRERDDFACGRQRKSNQCGREGQARVSASEKSNVALYSPAPPARNICIEIPLKSLHSRKITFRYSR
jgi:hypothetical protein